MAANLTNVTIQVAIQHDNDEEYDKVLQALQDLADSMLEVSSFIIGIGEEV